MNPPSTSSGHLVVRNEDIESSRAPQSEGAPLPGDSRSIQVVVSHRDVLGLCAAQIENAVVACGREQS